ncbi:MAG: hypothetical protein ABL888_10630 [Pirellulaceae bacterium]
MHVFENPHWIKNVVIVKKDNVGELLKILRDAKIKVTYKDIGLRVDETEVIQIVISEEQREIAKKAVRKFYLRK